MDMEALFVFALFGVFVALFVGLVVWSIRKDRAFRESLAALAAENGWQLETEAQTRNSGAGFHFLPAHPAEGWRATFRRPRPRKSSTAATGNGSTSFTIPEPAFRGGLVVVTIAQHPGMGSALTQLAGMFDNAIGSRLLEMVMGDSLGRYGGQLQEFPAPEGSKLTVMASTDPALFLDLAALGPLLHGWRPRHSGARTPPMVTISDEGVTLRLSYLPENTEDIRNLILLGRAIADALRAGARG